MNVMESAQSSSPAALVPRQASAGYLPQEGWSGADG